MARRQPSTLDTQRVTKRDTRQETKNQTNAEKKNPQKFNTGINLEAVFGAITQLLETFTSQVLDRNSVNMSLLLRTIYRNLDDDLVGILSEQKNVDYLNKQLEEKNKEVAQALAGGQTTTPTETPVKQEQPATPTTSEHLTTTVTNVERIKDTVIQKAPEVKVVPPEIITKDVETERTEKLPDVVEEEQVTERTEVLPEEVVESKTESTEVRTVPSLQNVSPSQRAFAAGEVTSDDNVDILELAQDFISELQSSAWKIQQTTGAMAQGLTDQYDEFTDKINEDDEDEYEWNLYRFMFRKQQEQNEIRKARMAEVLAKKAQRITELAKGDQSTGAEETPTKESPEPTEELEHQPIAEPPSQPPQAGPTEERVVVVEKIVEVEKEAEPKERVEPSPEVKESEKEEKKPEAESKPTVEEEKKPELPKAEKPEEPPADTATQSSKEETDKKKEDKTKKPKKGLFKALMDRFKASVKRRKDALLKKILPPVPSLGDEEKEEGKEEQPEEPKKGGLLAAVLRPFQRRREQQMLVKDLVLAAKDKESRVFLAPVPLRKPILSKLKEGKKLLKLWGRRNLLLVQANQPDQQKGETKKQGFWSRLFAKKAQTTKTNQKEQQPKAPKPTMVGRGILRAANTVNTVKNIFFKPKVHHIAVMNNAIVYPLWIKKVKDKSKKLGLLGRMKRAIFGDPAIKWKPLALGWRRFSKAQDKSMRELLKNRNVWRKMTYRWQKLYFKLFKQFQKERKTRSQWMAARGVKAPKDKVAKLVSKASNALLATSKAAMASPAVLDTIAAMDTKRKEDREKTTSVAPEVPAKKDPPPVAQVTKLAQSIVPSKPKEQAPPPTLEELYPREYVKKRLAELDGKAPEPEKPQDAAQAQPQEEQPRANIFVRMARSVVKKAGTVLGAKATEPTGEAQAQPTIAGPPAPPPPPPATPAPKVSLVKEPPKPPAPPPPPPKGVAPVVPRAAAAKGAPSMTKAPPAPPKAEAPKATPKVNPTLNTPKPQAQPQAEAPKKEGKLKRFAKGVVAIPGKMIDKARSLRKQQKQDQSQTGAAAAAGKEPPPKKPGLGISNARKAMGDDEAFRRNVNEGSSKIHEAFDDKKIQKMGFPHKKIADALKRFFGNTSEIAKKANKDLNDVEDAINNPKKGLWPTIKSWLIKIVIGGLLAIGILTWFRSNVESWMPRDKEGKMFHGPTIFGIQLPSFKDILQQGKALFYMVWTPMKKIIRTVTRGVKKFMKSNDINSAGKFVQYVKNFVMGFIVGKILAGVDNAMGGASGIASGAGKLGTSAGNAAASSTGILSKVLGFVKVPLMKVAEMVPIIGSIKMATHLAAMVGGALWCLFMDIFGKSESSEELVDEVAKYGEAKVKELVGENKHGKAAGNVLIHKAKQIKPLVPVQNLLPDHMKAKDAKGNLKLKALIPNLPQMKLAGGTLSDIADDVNEVADKRKESKMKESGQTGLKQIDKALGSAPEPAWDAKLGEPTPEKRATLKFINYAQQNINALTAARKKVGNMEDFSGSMWENSYLLNKGKDPKQPWSDTWRYVGKNKDLLKSPMPPEPFGDSTKGTLYEFAVPYEHEQMGIVPMGVRIPSTNHIWFVDAVAWERDRLDIGIDAWEGMKNLAMRGLESGDQEQMVGGKDFQKKMKDNGGWGYYGTEDWVRISTNPNWSSRINSGRKSTIVDAYNRWFEKHHDVKSTVKELREGLQPPPKPKPKPPEKKPADKKKEQKGLWSRFWAATKKVAKGAVKYGTGIGWLYMGGKKVWSLFKKKEAEKKPPPPPPPPPPWGLLYLQSELKKEPWKTLNTAKTKEEDLRKLFKVDSWFDKVPASDEKIYKEGIGKMFYNILLAMGFKYDKAVWQNPQFLKVRAKSMQAMVAAINGYVNDIIKPHGAYMSALYAWARKHKSIEEQDAVKKAAEQESKEIWKAITKDNFMEYVAKYYVPTDIHLVVRDKDGKIIKEEGKELKGWSVPKELYDQDPKYWDYVMSLMNESALPPESLLKLHETRTQLMMAIDAGTKKISKYLKNLQKKKLRLNMANILADAMLAFRMKLLTRTASNVKFRVDLAKKEIKMYFKYRKFLDTGSLGAFKSFITGGNKLSKKEQKMLFGQQIEGGGKSLSEKMLGSVSEVIADRRKLIKRMRNILRKVLNNGDKALRQQSMFSFGFVKSVVKSAGSKVMSIAKGVTSTVKGFVLGKVKAGMKIANTLKKATSINLNLFKLFSKKQADENDVKIQAEAAAKEMIPPDDKDGKERLKNIVKMSQERKEAAEKEKSGLKNYWANLRRQWKDRISEESMKELKAASTRLSDNIYDYLGMVRELPAGNTTIINTSINEVPSVIDLLPDITFC